LGGGGGPPGGGGGARRARRAGGGGGVGRGGGGGGPPPRAAGRRGAPLLDVEPAEVLMVASHGWDIDGARNVGLNTAFLERPLEKGPDGAPDRPGEVTSDLAVTSFTELAEELRC
jgi:hypothetical protein